MEEARIGRLDEFPAGEWRIVRVAGREVGVFNAGGRLHAVRNKCPHQGARLCVRPLSGTMAPSDPGRYEYALDGRVLTCPWHGWQFDVLSGGMVFGTGDRALPTYDVDVRDGEVFLDPTPRAARASANGAKGAT